MGGVVEYRDACVCSFVCALVCALVCLSVICLGHNTSDLRQICGAYYLWSSSGSSLAALRYGFMDDDMYLYILGHMEARRYRCSDWRYCVVVRSWDNAPAALYWLRRVLGVGRPRDYTSPS